MSMPFDATLKDLGREAPADILTTFDHAPTDPLTLLNVDLSTVTTAADLVIGLGDPLREIIHLDFQSAAAAWKHADILAGFSQMDAIWGIGCDSSGHVTPRRNDCNDFPPKKRRRHPPRRGLSPAHKALLLCSFLEIGPPGAP